MKRCAAVALMVVCMTAAAAAAGERKVAVTVYNNNLGLVKDLREIELAKGSRELSFTEVAALIDPTSVRFAVEGGGAEVLEQNYEYDLVSTSKLLDKALEQRVEIYTREDHFFDGVLLSADTENLVLRKEGEGGGINVVARDQVVHVALPDLAEGLVTRPTLRWLLQVDRPGTRAVEVDYLTSGIQWHAEYVGVSDESDRELDFSGWVSIDNQSGASYPDAELKLVAGEVRRVQPERPVVRTLAPEADMAGAKAGFEEEAFFEYHLYTLPRPTTIRDRQTKQITLFPSTHARVAKIFRYDGAQDPKNVRIELEMKNDAASGLGMALPAGTVRIYKRDRSGSLQFIGEDRIRHTPKDEKVDLYIGNAFDVVGERKVTESRRVTDRVREESYEISLRNHKEAAADVVVVEHLWGDWEILRSSHSYEKKDAFTVEFPVTVKPDEEIRVTYTARFGRM